MSLNDIRGTRSGKSQQIIENMENAQLKYPAMMSPKSNEEIVY